MNNRLTTDDLRLTGVAMLPGPALQHSNTPTLQHSNTPRFRRCSAFSLIEIMVAVALMSFIVLGLLAMFTQTQRAFRASMTQTDVLESGRIATDMIVRELGQMSASDRAYTTNFFAEASYWAREPLKQGLPGTKFKGVTGTED